MARRIRSQKQRRREVDIPELNVTPFMNLMIVLVPVLLLSLVFTHTTVIELDFPAGDSAAGMSDEDYHLEIQVLEDALVIADHRGIVKRLPQLAGQHDYAGLNQTLQAIKRQVPEKRDALLLLEASTDYQAIVSVMDSIRGYQTLQDGEAMLAELFPNVSLGDVPVDSAKDARGAS